MAKRRTTVDNADAPPKANGPTRDMDLAPSFDRLAKLSRLELDWDSYGAAPPDPNAIAMTGELLSAVRASLPGLPGERVRPWMIAPLAGGGVQAEWRGPGGVLEVEVSPDGTLGYLHVEGDGEQRRFTEADHVSLSRILTLVGRVLSD